ncbi:MAG: EAL domain-containing protein [Gammaproteobacteria bacterium]|nr:EAL domain-containing protein [Gammaproteobacteria bacterium]
MPKMTKKRKLPMKLRSKLFLPLILFSLFVASYSQFVWLPKYTSSILSNHQNDIRAHLRTAAEGLVPSLLEDRLANIYDNLDALLEQNEKWLSITLKNPNGKLLYPINIPETPSSLLLVESYQQDVSFGGPPLATLTLTVDMGEIINNANQLEKDFRITLYTLLFIVILTIGTIVELVVRRPIKALSMASSQLSKNNYHASIPKITSDEIGELIVNFVDMRNSIEAYQSKLKGEINDHKNTTKELIKQKEIASYQASHDVLTGLINRREFERRVKNSLDLSSSDNSSHVLLYIDLDQFKVVNDTCGHVAGDMLLRQLASLLQQGMRQHDTLARLGGDEFGVLFEYCNMHSAKKIATSLLETIQEFRFTWDNKLFNVGASIGAIEFTAHTGDYFFILSAADSACYSAKEQGRNRIQTYQPEDSDLSKRKGEMLWVTRLVQGIQENNFILYCQPVRKLMNSSGEQFRHYEILLRMRDKDGSIICPDKFIISAERYNLISKIDKWVVENTLKALTQYHNAPDSDGQLRLSVNLSGVSLGNNETLAHIENLFEKYNPPNGSIGIEITETAAIQKLSQAIRFMNRMKKHGCQFYLDDFGSGLSSYSYLKSIPADYVKIDGAFVKDIDRDPVDYAMVKSINEISHIMGKKTIAEFAESESIINKLQAIGVDYAQGYHIGKPFPLENLLKHHINKEELEIGLDLALIE